MARKSRAIRSSRRQTAIGPQDYRYPGETMLYWVAVGLVVFAFVIVVGLLLMMAKGEGGLNWKWLLILLWPAVSYYVSSVAPVRARRKQIQRAGPQSRVMGSTKPELFERLQSQARMLGFDQVPGLYVVDDEATLMYSLPGKPGSVVASQRLLSELGSEEFGALLARQLATIRAHNSKMRLAVNWVKNAHPAFRFLFFPMYAIATMLRGWVRITDFTADRGAVLLAGDESIVNAAILKMQALADPQADLSHDDIEAYLQGSEMSTDSAQVERHYKIGSFIYDQPNLKERIERIRDYRRSTQGQAAFEKVSELRGEAQSS